MPFIFPCSPYLLRMGVRVQMPHCCSISPWGQRRRRGWVGRGSNAHRTEHAHFGTECPGADLGGKMELASVQKAAPHGVGR
jgi:hypothetical protein